VRFVIKNFVADYAMTNGDELRVAGTVVDRDQASNEVMKVLLHKEQPSGLRS
jgi:hypothetical protein